MANTTSGTTTFDKSFSIDEIIEEAYDRLGIFTLNGGHMKTARRSLNIMFKERLADFKLKPALGCIPILS